MTSPIIREKLDAHLRDIIAIHFDAKSGAPYWIEKAAALRLDAIQSIRGIDDLALLGPMDSAALAQRPLEYFVPRGFGDQKSRWIVAETGGTLGRPRFAVHREDEFQAGFVTPFVLAAQRAGFPRELNWLFIGPSGPHIIGKAARACASALGSMDPFSVDFDPRWARKLPDQSAGRTRYLAHLEAQALNVLNTQNVGVLFATPPVLASLGGKIEPERRALIRGIHFGGMAVSAALRAKLSELFPNAVQLSGYGNTLFGVTPELSFSAKTGIDYFPHGLRLCYRLMPREIADECTRISQSVPMGERGQVLVHRLDETQFIANMIERDTAIRVAPPEDAAIDGFVLEGLRDPQPIVDDEIQPALGLY